MSHGRSSSGMIITRVEERNFEHTEYSKQFLRGSTTSKEKSFTRTSLAIDLAILQYETATQYNTEFVKLSNEEKCAICLRPVTLLKSENLDGAVLSYRKYT